MDAVTEPHVAGHATHFLRRLDRVSEEHVETALALYRDPELVREVLARAALDEGVERVAISLADPREGPFVVVTREGRFVTCLGAGMTPGALPVVTRERLDVASARVERMRERLAAARALAEEGGEASRLWSRLTRAGMLLHREDFEALARWEPLLARSVTAAVVDADVKVADTFSYLRTRRRKLTRKDEALLESWFYAFWAWSHAFVLMHVGDARERVAELAAQQAEGVDARFTLTAFAMRYGIVGPSVRALWAVSRHGRSLLASVKARPPESHLPLRVMRELPLAVIGHASSKARAEVVRALASRPAQPAAEFEAEWGRECNARLLAALADPERAAEAGERSMQELVARPFREVAGLPVVIRGPDDVPADIALATMACLVESWQRANGFVFELIVGLPRIARARPEELFLPREWAAPFQTGYSRELALELVDQMTDVLGAGTIPTVRASPRPSRNDPCPCGSGAKYKRCCGRR